MSLRKAQSSIEFLSVVGLALMISAPFIMSAQQAVVNVQQNSRLIMMENSLDKLESGVQMVSASGEPARLTFLFRVPDNVVKATVVEDRAVVYTVRTQAGHTNLSQVFDTNVSAPGGLPEQTSRLSVRAWNGQVNISVVS
ncbi:MAG: hypothetical protein ABEJ75_01795 [Candidatus Nanohaloarchaea archaeon]